MSKVSIVITTFNSIEFINSCLDSVFAQDYPDFEVIIVDNGSGDGSVEFMKEKYSRLILIENKTNLGAAKARNQGINISKGEWILILDCDIILAKDFLSKLINSTKNFPSCVGMFQPKVLNSDTETIYSVGIFLSPIRRFYDIGKGYRDSGQFNNRLDVFGACSAAAVYNRKMLEEIKENTGYFDERFFFLVEDVDLAWRAQRQGWKAVFCPEAVCYHSGNSSMCDRRTRRYFCFRNRLLLILKNERMVRKIMLIPIFFIYDLPRLSLLLFNSIFLNSRKEVPK